MKKDFKMERRNFFKRIIAGTVGLTFLSSAPLKILAKNRKNGKHIKVKIHPQAVRRNK